MKLADVSIVHPLDPTNLGLGGFDTCISDFIFNAPRDWSIELIGVTTNPVERPVGVQETVHVSGRPVRFIAALAETEPDRVQPIPLSLRFALQTRLRRIRPQGRIVQCHRFESVFAIGGGESEGKRVVYLHNDPARLIGSGGDVRWRGLAALYWAALSRSLSSADFVYVVNASSRSAVIERHPWLAGKVRHLPVWADSRVFRPQAQRMVRSNERALSGFPADAPVLIYAGRFERQKNLPLMLRAVAACHRLGTACGLLLVGKGREQPRLQRLAQQLGIAAWVHFHPPVSRQRLASLYQVCDLALCSSHFEGGPRHLIESLACGTPIASTDVGEAGEILASFPGAGALAEAHAPDALAGAIIRALELPSDSPNEQCLLAANMYDPVQLLAAVYERYEMWLAPPLRSTEN